MENPYKRRKEPELNKQLILEAATEIAANADWQHVTFQSIADRTGLSKGGIIHHFKNKEALLDELMKQSLIELNTWIREYREKNPDTEGAMVYLQAIVSRRHDERYKRTIRIILQGVMSNEQYRHLRNDWYKKNIMPQRGDNTDIKSLIIFLVADAIWYNENLGFSMFNDQTMQKIIAHFK